MKGYLKSAIGILAGFAVMSAFSGCSNPGPSAQSASPAANTSSTSASADTGTSSKEVVLIISTLTNPFFVSLAAGAQAEAQKLGYTLTVQNANNDSATELNMAQAAIAKKPACLILDPVDSDAIVTAINQANEAGVPVFAFDRMPSGGKILTFVGYDAINAGKNAADIIGAALNGTGKVAEIQGVMGTNVAQDRSKGFNDEMKAKFPNIEIVAQQPADFDRAKALNVATNVLQAHPDLNGIYAANDDMAIGVLSALQAQGLQGKVTLVGNDGIKDALDAVTAGTMYATWAESPFAEGMQVAQIAGDIIAGKTPPAATTLQGQLVNKDNVKKYWDYLASIGDPED